MINSLKSNGYSIAYYHLITDLETPYYNAKKVSPSLFQQHIRYFKKTKKFVSFQELSELRASNTEDLSQYIVLTFDDGYRLNVESVGNFLSDENIPATFFVTDCVLKNELMWRDHLAYAADFLFRSHSDRRVEFLNAIQNSKDWSYAEFIARSQALCENFGIPTGEDIIDECRPYMSVPCIKDLLECGHDVGLHSQSHPYFPNLTCDDAVDEVLQNYATLKDNVQKEPLAFSFPFGARHPESAFYTKVAQQTNVEYFCGINANMYSNSSDSNPAFAERLGMEDHRPLFVSTKVRPFVRGVSRIWK